MKRFIILFLTLSFCVHADYIQTLEDVQRLEFYNSLRQKEGPERGTIPKTLHFIWLGPKPLTSDSVKNIQGWIRLHPDWTVKFWTDGKEALSGLGAKTLFFKDFPLTRLEDQYFQCDNFGERSLLLRYAVLSSEGGVYVDHDVECLRAIDPIQTSCDFFCGMERFGTTVLSSSVNPSPHLVGAAPSHPILRSAIEWLQREWDRLERVYPGGDSSALFNRVQHRSFRALDMGIRESHGQEGRCDVVFPPHFFSLQEKGEGQYARHSHLGTWYTRSSEAEMKVEELLLRITKDQTQNLGIILGLTGFNLCLGILFFRKRRF